jgi:hypothetical protein
MSGGFQSYKNTTLPLKYMNTLTFPQWEKTSTRVRQPATGHLLTYLLHGAESFLRS